MSAAAHLPALIRLMVHAVRLRETSDHWVNTWFTGGHLMRNAIRNVLAAGAAGLLLSGAALAGDCTGNVVGVRPISQYNHAAGNGFLAVRSGPGTGYTQIGELYLGDEIAVWERQGNWLYVYCMSGVA